MADKLKLLQDFYAKYAPDVELTEDRIKAIDAKYGDNTDQLLKDFYAKYAPDVELNQERVSAINQKYGLKKKESTAGVSLGSPSQSAGGGSLFAPFDKQWNATIKKAEETKKAEASKKKEADKQIALGTPIVESKPKSFTEQIATSYANDVNRKFNQADNTTVQPAVKGVKNSAGKMVPVVQERPLQTPAIEAYAGKGPVSKEADLAELPNLVKQEVFKNFVSPIAKTIGIIQSDINNRIAYSIPGMMMEVTPDKVENYAAYKFGKAVDFWAETMMYPVSNETKESTIGQFTAGATSLGGYAALTAIGTATGAGTVLLPAVFGAMQNGSQEYERAYESVQDAQNMSNDDWYQKYTPGEDFEESIAKKQQMAASDPEQTAFDTWMGASVVGLAEGLPVMQWMKRINGSTGGLFAKAIAKSVATISKSEAKESVIKGAIEEGLQESLSQLFSNMNAIAVYDKTRELTEGVAESGTMGFLLGGSLNVITEVVKQKMADPSISVADKKIYEKTIEELEAKKEQTKDIKDDEIVKPFDDPENIAELKNKKLQLELDASDATTPEDVKQVLEAKIAEVDAQIDEARAVNQEDAVAKMTRVGEVAELEDAKAKLEEQISKSTPASREVLAPELQKINDNLNSTEVGRSIAQLENAIAEDDLSLQSTGRATMLPDERKAAEAQIEILKQQKAAEPAVAKEVVVESTVKAKTKAEPVSKPATVTPQALKQGSTIDLPAQFKGGMPRTMVYDKGEWKQQIGNETSTVSQLIQEQAQKAYDSQNKPRVSGKVGVGQESVQAKPVERGGQKEAPTSGDVQASEKVNEGGEFVVQGTFNGDQVIAGNKEYRVKDYRQIGQTGKTQLEENTKGDKKIFTLVSPNKDAFGRRGYMGVSLVLPNTTTKTNAEIEEILKKKTEEVNANLSKERSGSFNKAVDMKYQEAQKAEVVKPAEKVATEDVTDGEYKNFIDDGVVTKKRISAIANKVKNNEKLSPKETEIFTDKTSEVNKELKVLKGKDEKAAPVKEEVTKAEPTVEEEAEEEYTPITKKGVTVGRFTKDEAVDYEEDEKELDSGRMSTYISSMTVDVVDDETTGDSVGHIIKLKDEDNNVTWQAEDVDGMELSDFGFDTQAEALDAVLKAHNKKAKKEFDKEQKRKAKQKVKEMEKRAKAADKVANSLKSAGVKVKFVTSEEMDRESQKRGGKGGAEGVFLSDSGEVLIDRDNFEEGWGTTVVWHEGIHPILNIIRNTNPDLYNAAVRGLKMAVKASPKSGLDSALNWATKEYAVDGESTVNDEGLTESMARIADGKINLDAIPKSAKQAVIDFINKIAKALGLGQIINDTDMAKFKKLAGDIASILNEGRDIAELVGAENVKRYSFSEFNQSTSPGVVAAGQFSKTEKTIAKIDVYAGKEVDKLPVRTLADVHKQFGGRSVAINSDPTKVGELKLPSGKVIFTYGGPGFVSLKDNVKSNVAFATTQMQKVSKFNEYINELFPGEKGLGIIATQAPTSMLSNSYALRYVMDAISQLPKTVLRSSDFKSEFFGNDLVLLKDAFGEKGYNEFVAKYKSADLTSEKVINDMISEMAYKIGEDNNPASFKARGSFTANLLGGLVEKSKRKGYEGEKGLISVTPSKYVSKQLFDRFGLNAESLMYELGEKQIVDAFIKDGKWGFAVAGFETDPSIDIKAIQSKGLVHPLFNAKFGGVNPFFLDGGYELNKMYTPIDITSAKGNPYTKTAAQMLAGSMYVKGTPVQNDESKTFEQKAPAKTTGKIQAPEVETGAAQFSIGSRVVSEQEFKKRTSQASNKLLELFKRDNVPMNIGEASEMVKEVIDWADWYDGVHEYATDVFGEYAEDFLSIVPLASMNANSRAAVGLAINNIERIYKGEKPGGVAEYYNYVTDFLEGKGIKSDKMSNFSKALSGDKDAIAVDMHVWSIIMGKDPNKKQVNPKNQKEFDRAKEFVMLLSSELGLAPREVQASLWAANMLRTGSKPDSYEEYIQKHVESKGLKERIQGWRDKGYKPFSEVRKERELKNKPQASLPGGRGETATVNGVEEKVKPLPGGIDIVDGFYSPLEKKIVEFKQPNASANKWKEILGTKSDEAQFSGLADWLSAKRPDEQVKKTDIQQFIKDNRIEIKEIVKTDEGDQIGGTLAKFSSPLYNLPGEKEDYKETIITLPNRTKEALVARVADIDKEIDDLDNRLYEARESENREGVAAMYVEKRKLQDERSDAFDKITKEKEGEFYERKHYDEADILVHTRTDVRYDSDGNKVLFIEEVQSDWGQTGKRDGFKGLTDAEIKKIDQIKKEQNEILNGLETYQLLKELTKDSIDSMSQGYDADKVHTLVEVIEFNISNVTSNRYYDKSDPENVKRGKERMLKGIDDSIRYWFKFSDQNVKISDTDKLRLINAYQNDAKAGVSKQQGKDYDTLDVLKRFDELRTDQFKITLPNSSRIKTAPYVQKTNAWAKLGLKIALKKAVEAGAKSIAWTNGEQQIARYDLRKQVDTISYKQNPDGTYDVNASKEGVSAGRDKNLTPKKLEAALGKDIAQRIVAGEGRDSLSQNMQKDLTGEELAFGGAGMKAFYGGEGKPGIVGETAIALVEELTGKKGEVKEVKIDTSEGVTTQASIEITPALKASVKQGMPQFSKGGRENLAPNGKPSNLNEKQYEQVRTPEFKNWFGDWENDPKNASKIVDENGEPLVVYHGSVSTDIEEFDRSLRKRTDSGLKELGYYFTTNKTLAELYAKAPVKEGATNATGKIYEAFLNLRKVKEFDAKGEQGLEAWRNLEVNAGYKWATNRDAMDFLMNGRFGVEKVDGIVANNIVDMEAQGADVPQFKGTAYLVFDDNKNSIKSATDNTGEFSTTDNRIQASKGKRDSAETKYKEMKDSFFGGLPANKNRLFLADATNEFTHRGDPRADMVLGLDGAYFWVSEAADGYITIDDFQVNKDDLGTGKGKQALSKLIEYADANGVTLIGEPLAQTERGRGEKQKGLSQKDLVAFYKKYGFAKISKEGLSKNSRQGVESNYLEKLPSAQASKGNRDVQATFSQATDLFYQIRDTEGAAKKKRLADERKALMDANPSVKYIDDNIKNILDQLEKNNKATRKGNCP
jgi:GNAT superfamily N-acetyltransferase